jgi:type I restriction enzyme S subunit
MSVEPISNSSGLPDVPSDWSTAAIETLCTRVTSGATPLRSKAEYYDGGTIPWIRTQELKDGIIRDSAEKITPAALKETSAKLFPVDTVLMAMYGDGKTITSLGVLGIEAATNQACCAMITDQSRCFPTFII